MMASASRSETGQTGKLVRAEIRNVVAEEIKLEVKGLIRSRYTWKKGGDYAEAIAKGLTGVSSILAFASSAVKDTKTADILAFTSGTIGTFGLVLLAYSTYASKESRQRTTELNSMLAAVGVTPVVEIASGENNA